MRDKALAVFNSCSFMKEHGPEEIEVLLWLFLASTPQSRQQMELSINEQRLTKVLSDMKQKALICQLGTGTKYSMTKNGIEVINKLLAKIQ